MCGIDWTVRLHSSHRVTADLFMRTFFFSWSSSASRSQISWSTSRRRKKTFSHWLSRLGTTMIEGFLIPALFFNFVFFNTPRWITAVLRWHLSPLSFIWMPPEPAAFVMSSCFSTFFPNLAVVVWITFCAFSLFQRQERRAEQEQQRVVRWWNR